MTSSKLGTLLGALVFLALAAVALYRLLVGFRIAIGGVELGQTTSFLAFVAFAALALMLFRSTAANR